MTKGPSVMGTWRGEGAGHLHVTAGILSRNGRFLICQRGRTGSFPLKWEFPGGKLQPGETPERALTRELGEELGILIRPEYLEYLETVHHRYAAGPEVRIDFFRVKTYEGEPVNLSFEAMVWAPPSQLAGYDFLEADRSLVARLAAGKLFSAH